MTADRKTLAELERDEQWLRGTAAADPPAPLERIKLRVRIEVNQVWLERNASTDPAPRSLQAVRHAARAAVQARATPSARRAVPWWRARRWVGFAAAAVVVFACGVAMRPRSQPAPPSIVVTVQVKLDDWFDAVATDAGTTEDTDTGLTALEDGVDTLEASLGEEGTLIGIEQELYDVGDAVDAVLTQLG